MRTTLQIPRQRSERGSVAVEAAILLPVLVLFLTFQSLFWALYFYKYSSAQKAVHDAALYLSTAPMLEMTTVGPDGDPAALTLAKKILAKEMAGQNPPSLGIVCNYRLVSGGLNMRPCTTANNLDYRQTLVQIGVSLNMNYIDPMTGFDSGLRISPGMDVPYMGN